MMDADPAANGAAVTPVAADGLPIYQSRAELPLHLIDIREASRRYDVAPSTAHRWADPAQRNPLQVFGYLRVQRGLSRVVSSAEFALRALQPRGTAGRPRKAG